MRNPANRRPTASLFLIGLMVPIGCSGIRYPNWGDPGNAATQQYNAILYDPYPSANDGPEIVGGRPRAYQAEVPPVKRARMYADQQNRTVAPPPPAFAPGFPAPSLPPQ